MSTSISKQTEKMLRDTQLAQFWYTLVEHGLEPECITCVEALGELNNKHPLTFVVEALHEYVSYLSQEPQASDPEPDPEGGDNDIGRVYN